MFEERTATNAHDPLARPPAWRSMTAANASSSPWVDSCMLPRDLIDRRKRCREQTHRPARPTAMFGVRPRHTQLPPPSSDGLSRQARVDPPLRACICPPKNCRRHPSRAVTNLAPARIGWAAVDDYEHTLLPPLEFVARTNSSPIRSASKTSAPNMHPRFISVPIAIGAVPVRSIRVLSVVVRANARRPSPLRVAGELLDALLRSRRCSRADYYGAGSRTRIAKKARRRGRSAGRFVAIHVRQGHQRRPGRGSTTAGRATAPGSRRVRRRRRQVLRSAAVPKDQTFRIGCRSRCAKRNSRCASASPTERGA